MENQALIEHYFPENADSTVDSDCRGCATHKLRAETAAIVLMRYGATGNAFCSVCNRHLVCKECQVMEDVTVVLNPQHYYCLRCGTHARDKLPYQMQDFYCFARRLGGAKKAARLFELLHDHTTIGARVLSRKPFEGGIHAKEKVLLSILRLICPTLVHDPREKWAPPSAAEIAPSASLVEDVAICISCCAVVLGHANTVMKKRTQETSEGLRKRKREIDFHLNLGSLFTKMEVKPELKKEVKVKTEESPLMPSSRVNNDRDALRLSVPQMEESLGGSDTGRMLTKKKEVRRAIKGALQGHYERGEISKEDVKDLAKQISRRIGRPVDAEALEETVLECLACFGL